MTVDEVTLDDDTVTLREIVTMKQIRIPVSFFKKNLMFFKIDELARVVW